MVRYTLHTILILLSSLVCVGQEQPYSGDSHIEAIFESIAGNAAEENDGSLILEDLQEYLSNRLNINIATHEQLSRLHVLDDVQIDRLLQYRKDYGRILTIYELNTIEGFHPDILMQIEPFIQFGPVEHVPLTTRQLLKRGRHELLFRTHGILQKQEGFLEQDNGTIPYEGDRYRYYMRYKFQAEDILSAGITADKDPGESFFTGSNPHGFDFCSAYLGVRVNKVVQNITLGDYVVRSGQGLVLWQGFSLGRPVHAINFSRTGRGVRPYSSSGESNFFRGAAASLNFGHTGITFFISNKTSDANVVTSDSAGTCFTSLPTSGYHRTASEIADEKRVADFNTGTILNYRKGNIRIGAVFLYQRYGMPFEPTGQLYNRFSFRGTENYLAGIDYLFSKGKYQLFGEAAVSRSGGKAAVQGITLYLHDRIQLSALARHFDRNYHANRAAPFSKSSTPSDETGLYAGIRILPVSRVVLSGWTDYYRSDWVKYTTAGPSDGWDVFLQAEVTPYSRLSITFRYKNEERARKHTLATKKGNFTEELQKSRIHIQYQLSPCILLKSRIEHVSYFGAEKEHGLLAFQDVQLASESLPLNLTVRLGWFNTDGYNSRIYTWENDLLYAYAIPAYYGKGFRSYLNMKYRLASNLDVWLKLGNSLYPRAASIGSGYNQIDGNQKTELKFQLRFKL